MKLIIKKGINEGEDRPRYDSSDQQGRLIKEKNREKYIPIDYWFR
jgi:hypothetical protein